MFDMEQFSDFTYEMAVEMLLDAFWDCPEEMYEDEEA